MKEIKSKLLSCFILLCAIFFASEASLQAQLEVTGGFTADEMAQILVGAGVDVFNAEIDCGDDGAGSFDGEFTNIGMNGGIVLTSGTIDNAVGPNDQGGITGNLGTGSDPDLDLLIPGFGTNDACVFEFDFIPFGDSIQFNYAFGSDEYLEFAFSNFNDVFGFFLSGPGISGGAGYTNDAINIALIPGTTDAVAIDNVNDVNNSQYFVCNGDPNNQCQPFNPPDINSTVQYDGLTTVLQAIAAVNPCDTYHLKMAIADAGDSAFDSGVFLEASSLSVDIVTISATTTLTTVEGLENAVEGCVDGIITFSREFATSSSAEITYEISGTATNGDDYTFLPGVIEIPPNETEAELFVDFLDDGIDEDIETFTITVTTDFGCDEELVQEATIEIVDAEPLAVSFDEVTIQLGDMVELEATGGGLNYFWTPLQSITGANTTNPTVFPEDTTTYTITSAIGDCIYQETVTVNVVFDNCNPNAFFEAPAEICACDDVVELMPIQAGGTWSGSGVDANGVFNPSVLGPGVYTITYTITEDVDCFDTYSTDILVYALPNPSFMSASFCSGAAPAALTPVTPGGEWTGEGIDENGVFNPEGLEAGEYEITYTVTNEQGASASETNVVTIVDQADASFTPQSFCQGDAPAQLEATTLGGTWSGTGVTPSGVFDPMSVSAGSYTITHTVGAGSCSDASSEVIVVNPLPNSSFSHGTFAPNGASAALVPVTPGGTWSGANVDANGVFDPTNVAPGAYPVTYSVTSADGCSTSTTFNVSVIQLGDACFPPQSFCQASGPVALLSNEAGGSWSGPGVSVDGVFNPSSVGPGVYTLTHTIGMGVSEVTCDGEITVFSTPDPNFIQEDFCEMGPASSITPVTPGGTWSGVGITAGGVFDPAGLAAGNYAITYTIYSGVDCSASLTQNITIFPLPNSSFNEVSFCEGTGPTQLSAATPGGTWDGIGVSASGVFDPSSVGVGSYIIGHTVQGEGGCVHVSNRIITVIASGDASFSGASVCTGGSPIQLTATNPGGTWSGAGVDANGVFNPAGLQAGDYTISYSVGGEGCEASSNNTVSVLPLPNSTFSNAFVCSGGGAIQLVANTAGGTWSGSGVSASGVFDPAGLAVGTYTVTYNVTNAQGCSSSSSGTVTVGALANSTFAGAFVCTGGNPIQLTAVTPGGTWSGTGISASGVFDPAGLPVGAYTVSYNAPNAQGCNSTSSGTVTVGALPNSSFNDVTVCEGASVQLMGATPGGTWSGTNISSSGLFGSANLAPGTYTVSYSVGDAQGCSSSSTGTVTVASEPVTSFPDVYVCIEDGPTQLSASVAGGVWSGIGVSTNGVFDPTTLFPGVYELTYTFTNSEGCISVSTGNVSVSNQPDSSFSGGATCENGDPIQLVPAIGGGTWSGTGVNSSGVFNPMGLAAGVYTINYTVTNLLGCSSTTTSNISVSVAPNSSFANNFICEGGGSVQLVADDLSGTWSGDGVSASGVFNANGLNAGTYSVSYTVTNIAGCSTTTNGSVTVGQAPNADFADAFVCTGGSVQLAATMAGGTWSGTGVDANGFFNSTGLGAGTYSVNYSVTTDAGCSSSSTGTVTVGTGPSADFADAFVCLDGGSIQLTANTANGTWSGSGISASGVFMPTAPGNYTVSYTVASAEGCVSTASGTVTVGDVPNSSVTDAFVCSNGDAIQLEAATSGGTWSGEGVSASGMFNPEGLSVGTYEVTYSVTDASGCSSTSTGNVTVGALPNTSFNDVFVCQDGGAVTLSVSNSGGTWSGDVISADGTVDPANLAAGDYTVSYTFTSAQGCTSTSTGTVSIGMLPDTSADDAEVCEGAEAIQLTAAMAGGTWSGDGVSADGMFTPSAPGSYTVTYSITTDSDCSSSSTATVTVNPLPDASADDAQVCEGSEAIQLTAASSGGTWSGDGVSADGMFTPGDAGFYTVTYSITTDSGCSSSSTATVIVSPLPDSSFDDLTLCIDDAPAQLTGATSGGTWSGAGIEVDGTFDPAGVVAGTYEVTYTVITDEGCSTSTTGTVTVVGLPEVSIIAPAFTCYEAEAVTLTASPDGGTWDGADDGVFDPAGLEAGDYEVTYTYTNESGCTASTSVSITVLDPVEITVVSDPVCIGFTGNYEMVVSVSGGNGGPYDLDGASVEAGAEVTLSGLGDGNEVSYTATDDDGCTATYTFTSEVCGTCNPIAGTVEDAIVCGGDDLNIVSSGVDISTVDALVYAIHLNPVLVEDDIIHMTEDPIVSFDFIGIYGTYYVTAIATNLDEIGNVDFDGECIDLSDAATVTFVEPIEIVYDFDCDGDAGIFTMTYSFTGGQPSIDPTATYEVTGDAAFDAIFLGENFTLDYPDASNIDITVTDGFGCTASLNVENVNCVKCGSEEGEMPQEPILVCGAGTAQAQAVDFAQFGTNLVYIFHTEIGDGFPGEMLASAPSSSQGIFSFDDIPGAEFDTEYYISAVIGPLDANGFPIFDPFNSCIVIMPGPMVTFSSGGLGVEVFTESDCSEDYSSFVVIVNVDAPADTEFTVTVGASSGVVSGGAPFISAPFPTGSGYEVVVSDGSCSTSVVNPQTFCAPATNIELLDFTGFVKTEGNQLEWSLATADDLKHFVIERSFDGQDFRLVDVVPGQGNSNTVQGYDYFDATAPGGLSYYRLQMVENNGEISYSNTITLERPTMDLEIVSLQPVPAKDELVIILQSEDLEDISLAVFDISGKQIAIQNVELTAGINTISLDVSAYAAGIYTLQMSNGTTVVTERLIKE